MYVDSPQEDVQNLFARVLPKLFAIHIPPDKVDNANSIHVLLTDIDSTPMNPTNDFYPQPPPQKRRRTSNYAERRALANLRVSPTRVTKKKRRKESRGLAASRKALQLQTTSTTNSNTRVPLRPMRPNLNRPLGPTYSIYGRRLENIRQNFGDSVEEYPLKRVLSAIKLMGSPRWNAKLSNRTNANPPEPTIVFCDVNMAYYTVPFSFDMASFFYKCPDPCPRGGYISS